MCHSQLLSSPAGRHSATHSGPRCICHCHCTTQGNPLQSKAHRIEVGLSMAHCSYTHSHSACQLTKCFYSLSAHRCPQHPGRLVALGTVTSLRGSPDSEVENLLRLHSQEVAQWGSDKNRSETHTSASKTSSFKSHQDSIVGVSRRRPVGIWPVKLSAWFLLLVHSCFSNLWQLFGTKKSSLCLLLIPLWNLWVSF